MGKKLCSLIFSDHDLETMESNKRKRDPDDDASCAADQDQELASMLGSTSSSSSSSTAKRTKTEEISDEEAEAKRFLEFYDSLSPDQQRRYEAYRRSRLHPTDVRHLMLNQTGSSRKVTEPASIVVAGLTKLFVGDIVERARVIMEKRKEKGPICPQHLREAYRQLQQSSQLPLIRTTTTSLRR